MVQKPMSESESESESGNGNKPLYLKFVFSRQVQAITERTIRNDHPYRGLHIAWVGTIYYDYAEQVLAKGPNSEECSRMYNIAEQKLYEVRQLLKK